MQRKSKQYLSPANHNELLKIMAVSVLRTIAKNLQSTEFISMMIDECTDIANKEQV